MDIKLLVKNFSEMSPEEQSAARGLLESIGLDIDTLLSKAADKPRAVRTTSPLVEYYEKLVIRCSVCNGERVKFLHYQPRVINGGHVLIAVQIAYEEYKPGKTRTIHARTCHDCPEFIQTHTRPELANIMLRLAQEGRINAKDFT